MKCFERLVASAAATLLPSRLVSVESHVLTRHFTRVHGVR